MLLKMEHVNSAMNLAADTVTLALHNKGYREDKVKTATFSGMTPNGSFVYLCTYFDTDTGKDEDAIVYVQYNSNRVLVADY